MIGSTIGAVIYPYDIQNIEDISRHYKSIKP